MASQAHTTNRAASTMAAAGKPIGPDDSRMSIDRSQAITEVPRARQPAMTDEARLSWRDPLKRTNSRRNESLILPVRSDRKRSLFFQDYRVLIEVILMEPWRLKDLAPSSS